MTRARLLITVFGGAVAGLGIWHLISLVTIARTYGTYPDGYHLWGMGLFIFGALFIIFGNFLCDIYEKYQKRKDDIYLSS